MSSGPQNYCHNMLMIPVLSELGVQAGWLTSEPYREGERYRLIKTVGAVLNSATYSVIHEFDSPVLNENTRRP